MANSYHERRWRQMIAQDPDVTDKDKAQYFGFITYLQWCGEYQRRHRRKAPHYERYLRITGSPDYVESFVQTTKTHRFAWVAEA